MSQQKSNNFTITSIIGLDSISNVCGQEKAIKGRVVKGKYADNPDPLIALLGTVECYMEDTDNEPTAE